jgi:hypothetical protein
MGRRGVGGWAAVAAALLSALFSTVYFVFTHGSGARDRHAQVLGIDSVTVCRASALPPLPWSSPRGACVQWWSTASVA